MFPTEILFATDLKISEIRGLLFAGGGVLSFPVSSNFP
jgi:hypothetical protein